MHSRGMSVLGLLSLGLVLSMNAEAGLNAKKNYGKKFDGQAVQTKTINACKADETRGSVKFSKGKKVERKVASSEDCVGYSSIIYGGQTYNTGGVSVTNDATNVNIALTSNSAAGWFIRAIHIYVGTNPIPVNGQGNPAPGQFPIQNGPFDPPVSGYSYAIPFADLAIACGTSLNIAIHTEMVKLDATGTVIQEETGWAFGPNRWEGQRWGWYFTYTPCCVDTTPHGCTLTQGYWKTHSKFATKPALKITWPIAETTTLCGKTWYSILQTSPAGGDAWTILAHQWIAAKLNVAAGASTGSIVDAALSGGESLLTQNCGGISGDDRQTALESSLLLDNYNNGIIGPGHCN